MLVAVTLGVMGRVCLADFTIFDDFGTIYANPWLKAPPNEALAHYWGGWRTGSTSR
jgi:hypothetical protein